jgi:spermidine synthase
MAVLNGAPAKGSVSPKVDVRSQSDVLPGRRLALLALFVVSGVGLIFEITLTRLFSLYFQYHFTFLAVSLAVLGLSLGAASVYFINEQRTRSVRTLILVLTALSVSLSAAAFLIAKIQSVESIFPRALVAVIPFFLIGLFDALVFEIYHEDSGEFYGADLVGASIGVITVLGLLYVWSAFSMVLFLALLVGLVAVAFGLRATTGSLRIGAIASLVVAVLLLGLNLTTGLVEYDPYNMIGAPRDKTMVYILQDENQGGQIINTNWSPFARVDVVQTNDDSSRYIFADGGAGAYMMAYDGDLGVIDNYAQTVDYLPFLAGDDTSTLVVGAGGGRDVLLAAHAGAEEITAVEVNPAIIDAVREDDAYNGSVFDQPGVRLIEGDARSFVERDDTQYDLIYMNLVYTQAVEPASQTLVENYLFTREAFRTYLERLAPGGRLAIIAHNALEGSRAAITALQAMEDLGTPAADGLDHLWMWMYPADDETVRTSVLIVTKDPLVLSTTTRLNQLATGLGMQALYAPRDYETLFEPLRNNLPLSTYISDDAAFNLAPTIDDQPYFFNLDNGIPPAIRSSLVMAVLLAVALLGLAAFAFYDSRSVANPLERERWWPLTAYALLIGLGFMLVEIPLIQRFQVLLGQPIWSLTAVLTTLLLTGGLGSWVSQRWSETQLASRLRFVALWIGALSIVYWFVLPSIVEALLPMGFEIRLLGIIILTALLGFPMGMPFPSLLRFAGKTGKQGKLVALLWAINGAFSVLGSTLSVVIAMQWGFRWALLFGAVLYLALAVVVWLFLRPTQPVTATR